MAHQSVKSLYWANQTGYTAIFTSLYLEIHVKYLEFHRNVRPDVSPLVDDIVVTAGGDVLLIF